MCDKNKLTVDDKLLALLFAHASAILSINKPINIRAARAANCKRLPGQETIQGRKHLRGQRGTGQIEIYFCTDSCNVKLR